MPRPRVRRKSLSILFCGTLEKRQRMRRKYVSRYMVLTSHRLHYFVRTAANAANNYFGEERGWYNLRDITRIDGGGSSGGDDACVFTLTAQDKQHEFRASSAEMAMQWRLALGDAITWLRDHEERMPMSRGAGAAAVGAVAARITSVDLGQTSPSPSTAIRQKNSDNSNDNGNGNGTRSKRASTLSGDYRGARQIWPDIAFVDVTVRRPTISLSSSTSTTASSFSLSCDWGNVLPLVPCTYLTRRRLDHDADTGGGDHNDIDDDNANVFVVDRGDYEIEDYTTAGGSVGDSDDNHHDNNSSRSSRSSSSSNTTSPRSSRVVGHSRHASNVAAAGGDGRGAQPLAYDARESSVQLIVTTSNGYSTCISHTHFQRVVAAAAAAWSAFDGGATAADAVATGTIFDATTAATDDSNLDSDLATVTSTSYELTQTFELTSPILAAASPFLTSTQAVRVSLTLTRTPLTATPSSSSLLSSSESSSSVPSPPLTLTQRVVDVVGNDNTRGGVQMCVAFVVLVVAVLSSLIHWQRLPRVVLSFLSLSSSSTSTPLPSPSSWATTLTAWWSSAAAATPSSSSSSMVQFADAECRRALALCGVALLSSGAALLVSHLANARRRRHRAAAAADAAAASAASTVTASALPSLMQPLRMPSLLPRHSLTVVASAQSWELVAPVVSGDNGCGGDDDDDDDDFDDTASATSSSSSLSSKSVSGSPAEIRRRIAAALKQPSAHRHIGQRHPDDTSVTQHGVPAIDIDTKFTDAIATHADAIQAFYAAVCDDIVKFLRPRNESTHPHFVWTSPEQFAAMRARVAADPDGIGVSGNGEHVRDSMMARWTATSKRKVLQFLHARNYKIADAVTMWRRACIWRENEGMDYILYEPAPVYEDVLRAQANTGPHGVSRDGRVINVEILATLDVGKLLSQFCVETVVRQKTHMMEYRLRVCLPGRDTDQISNVLSCSGLTRKNLTRHTFAYLGQLSAVVQDNYPELLGSLHIIHAGWLLKTAWTVVSPLLSEHTKSKIRLHKDGARDVLDQQIGLENLPPAVGGACACAASPCYIPSADSATDDSGLEPVLAMYVDITRHGWHPELKQYVIVAPTAPPHALADDGHNELPLAEDAVAAAKTTATADDSKEAQV